MHHNLRGPTPLPEQTLSGYFDRFKSFEEGAPAGLERLLEHTDLTHIRKQGSTEAGTVVEDSSVAQMLKVLTSLAAAHERQLSEGSEKKRSSNQREPPRDEWERLSLITDSRSTIIHSLSDINRWQGTFPWSGYR
ncbi:MAG: hypothetical protein ACR2NF_01245 [Pirellulales bacterium]